MYRCKNNCGSNFTTRQARSKHQKGHCRLMNQNGSNENTNLNNMINNESNGNSFVTENSTTAGKNYYENYKNQFINK